MADKDTILAKADIAETTERYDDMAEFMTQYIDGEYEMTKQARNYFSVAFKNCIGALRSAHRIMDSKKTAGNPSELESSVIDEYMGKVKSEFEEKFATVMRLIDSILGKPDSLSDESKVFYYKMKGDYARYKVEFLASDSKEKEDVKEISSKAYLEAENIAKEKLPPTDPTRLGLSLNFSVFYYEIEKKIDKACEIAKQAFDNAIAELDRVPEDSYKDSTLIMQLLRDNLTLWSAGPEEDETQNE